jgi:hypothetical protein
VHPKAGAQRNDRLVFVACEEFVDTGISRRWRPVLRANVGDLANALQLD